MHEPEYMKPWPAVDPTPPTQAEADFLEVFFPGVTGLPNAEEVLDPETFRCGLTYPISYGEDPEYDRCGDPAVACYEEQGRCGLHLEEFMYLEHWGFIPKPKFTLWLLDTPKFFTNDKDDIMQRWLDARFALRMFDF